MATIDRLLATQRIASTAPHARRTAYRFGVMVELPDDAAPPAAASPLSNLDSLLALQEREDDGVADRRATAHSGAMLDALAGMQVALLEPDGVSSAQLGRLAGLAQAIPYAATPGLRDLADAIGLRARIELVKRGLPIPA